MIGDFSGSVLLDASQPKGSDFPTVPVTYYSLGGSVGGPDEIEDKWTNQGYSSTGQNLAPGIVAVNDSVYPLGTIFRDEDSGEVFIAGDRHGNDDPNVVDIFESASRYNPRKEGRRLSVVGRAPKVPNSVEGLRELLSQYGNVPGGESALDFLNGLPPSPGEDVIPLNAPAADFQGATVVEDDGVLEQGNIDLHNRPKVSNPDGTYSTVRSITVDEDGKSVLIPTVVGDKVVSDDEAIANYKKTGQHLGKFRDRATADTYAQKLHEDQQKEYDAPPDFAGAALVADTTGDFQGATVIPDYPDPAQWPDVEKKPVKFSDVINQFARGATSDGGIYSMTEGASRMLADTVRPVDRIEMGPDGVPNVIEQSPTYQDEQGRDKTDWWAAMRSGLAETLSDYADATAQTRGDIRSAMPVSDEFKNSLAGQIVGGFGQLPASVVAYTIPGLGPLTSVGGVYDETYQDAIAHGLDPVQAHGAAMAAIPASALDVAADKLVIGKILKPLKGKITVGDLAKTFVTTAGMGGATEALQQGWQNFVAKYLSGYDPNRKLDDDVINSFLVGAIVDSAVSTGGQAVVSKLAPKPEGEAKPAPAPEAETFDPEKPAPMRPLPTLPRSEAPEMSDIERSIREDVERKKRQYEAEENGEEFFQEMKATLDPEGDERFAPKSKTEEDEVQMADADDGLTDDTTPANLFEFEDIPQNELSREDAQRIQTTEAVLNKPAQNSGNDSARTRIVLTPKRRVGSGVERGGVRPGSFIDAFNSLTGTKTIFVDTNEDSLSFKALVRSGDPNTIYVHVRADRPIEAMLGHEWGHTLQNQDKELYRDLQRAVFEYTDNWRKRVRSSIRTDLYSTPKKWGVELTNNTLGDAFMDPEFWKSVHAHSDKTLFQRLYQSAIDFFDSLISKARTAWGTEAFSTDLRKMRDKMARIVAEAIRKGPYVDGKPTGDNELSFIAGGPTIKPFVKGAAKTSGLTKTRWSFSRPAFDFERLYMGTADILSREKGLKFLATAIRKHVDTQRKYLGELTAPYRAWNQSYKPAERKQAHKEFEGYWRERERNPDLAKSTYWNASDAGKELIDLWKKTADYTARINRANNVMVWDNQTKTLRPIGRAGSEYFPRMMNPKVLEVLKNPAQHQADYNKLVREMLAERLIKDPSEAESYVDGIVDSYKINDHFGAIENARNLPLPNSAYDYSFETSQRYINAWAERMAQIEAFGQKLRGANAGRDLFDDAQEQAGDERTKNYIKLVQDRAYNARLDSGWAQFAGGLNTVATGLQLGNPMSALKNLISGTAFTAQAYGARRTLAAMGSLVKDWRQIDDAFEKGILLDDLMNVMQDAEQWGVDRTSKLSKGTNALLNLSGFNSAETFVRGTNMVAARAMLRDAIRANEKNPVGRRALQYRGYFARLGVKSPESLIAENGEGPLTDQFLRAAVNEVQGGYRYDQVPAFMDSPVGKFLFKYQKWGSQQTRHFARNVANPALQFFSGGKVGRKEFVRVRNPKTGEIETKQVPGAILPLARYAVFIAAAGLATEKLLEFLFGTPEKGATMAEILAKLDRDQGEAFTMLISKLWGYHLIAGSMGQLGNYAQMAMDVADRSRFKNPLDPPGVSIFKGVGNLVLDALEQGKVDGRNVDELLRSQVSQYRTGKQLAARLNNVLGADIKALALESRRQDLQWLRGVTNRYNDQIGVQSTRTAIGRVGKSEETPFRASVKEALLLGDKAEARRLVREHFAGMSAEQKKVRMTALIASIRASQPIKAGYGSEAMRENFLDWAKQNLSPGDFWRVRQIDDIYRKTAIAVGLMKPVRDISDADLIEAMRKIQAR